MRGDMCKVIVERPRPGSSRHVARRSRRLDIRSIVVCEDADDAYPSCIGHRRAAAIAGDRKWLNENLAPLRRYLERQAGRAWDEVWSEICANIDTGNAVQKHVLEHVEDFVAVHTQVRNGEIVAMTRLGGLRPLQGGRWLRLYVDPATGALRRIPEHLTCRAERKRAQREAAVRNAERMRVLAADRQLHLLDDGNWWEVTLAPTMMVASAGLPSHVRRPLDVEDVVERAGMSRLPRQERYGRWGVHAIAKRPLSRREIRRLALRR